MSAHDAAAGWLHVICGQGPQFDNFLSQEGYEEVFVDPRAVMAGSLNPLGGAVTPVDSGDRFGGCATNVSGCLHSNWLMAGAWCIASARRRGSTANRR